MSNLRGSRLSLDDKFIMKTQNGFTLIELMITVSLLAVMMTLGVPAFQSTIQSNTVAAKSNAFLSAVKIARSEATKRRDSVIICASDTQTNCNNTNGWSDGWIVFVDDGLTTGVFDVGEDIITSYLLPTGFTVARAAGGADQIIFSATGISDSTVGEFFDFCITNATNGRNFVVERSGIVSATDKLDCP